jgi:hypothetical protein
MIDSHSSHIATANHHFLATKDNPGFQSCILAWIDALPLASAVCEISRSDTPVRCSSVQHVRVSVRPLDVRSSHGRATTSTGCRCTIYNVANMPNRDTCDNTTGHLDRGEHGRTRGGRRLCQFRRTTSPACGPCAGRRQRDLAARRQARPLRSAPRCGLNEETTTRERTNP